MKKIKILNLIIALGYFGIGNAQWQYSGSNIYFNTGNVGIGTIPASNTKLQVANGLGTVNFLNPSSTSNVGELIGINGNANGARIMSINSFGGLQNQLIGEIGVNFGIDGNNGTSRYVYNGAKKAPIISFDADNGRITLFGENGTGSNYRSASLNQGLTVAADGTVGIGINTPANQLAVINKSSFGGNAAVSYEPIEAQGSNAGLSLYDRIGGSAERWVIYSLRTGAANTNTLRFWTGGADIMSISPNGNVNMNGQLNLADVYGAGGKNLLIGNDAYLTDIDQTNILGIYGNVNSDRAGIQLGSSGPTLFGLNGNIGIGTTNPISPLQIQSSSFNSSKVNVGYVSNGANLSYAVGFMGFNAARKSDATWNIDSDGTNNGGTAIIGDIFGQLRFISVAPANGNTSRNLTDAQIINNTAILIDVNKRVIIGDATHLPLAGDHKLAVDGFIYCKKVIVTNSWSDYVFDKKYKLLSLDSLEKYIETNSHLPEIPNAKEIESKGIDTGEMLKLQMAKIEELTLYIIKLKKEIDSIKK